KSIAVGGGRAFVTGISQGVARRNDFATIAYSVSTGHEDWIARFDDRGHRNDAGRDVVVAPDDSAVYVTGKAGRRDATIAYDASTGTQRWAVGNRRGAARPLAVEAIAPDGGTLFATGDGTIVADDTDSGN